MQVGEVQRAKEEGVEAKVKASAIEREEVKVVRLPVGLPGMDRHLLTKGSAPPAGREDTGIKIVLRSRGAILNGPREEIEAAKCDSVSIEAVIMKTMGIPGRHT